MNTEIKKFAVLGNPIEHSWSPLIHKSFAKQFNLPIDYEKIKVASNSLDSVLTDLITQGYLGFNITVPFKQEAFQLCLKNKWNVSARALKARAINTLSLKEKSFFLIIG